MGGNWRECKVMWSDNVNSEVVCGRWEMGLQVIKEHLLLGADW